MVDPQRKERSDAAKSRAKERDRRWSYAGFGIGVGIALLLNAIVYSSGSLNGQMTAFISLALLVVIPYAALLIASGMANRISAQETVRINQALIEAEWSRRER